MFNYGVTDNDAIEYEMKAADNGWILCVKVPSKTSANDQVAVLDWIREYQGDVKRLHPHWLTAFRETEAGYMLFIQKADSVHDMLNAVGLMQSGDRVRDYWTRSLEYAG